MVRLPSLDRNVAPPIHVSVMSRVGAVYSAQRHSHNVARYVHQSEPGARKERGREESGSGEVSVRGQRTPEAAEERWGRRRGGEEGHRECAGFELEGGRY